MNWVTIRSISQETGFCWKAKATSIVFWWMTIHKQQLRSMSSPEISPFRYSPPEFHRTPVFEGRRITMEVFVLRGMRLCLRSKESFSLCCREIEMSWIHLLSFALISSNPGTFYRHDMSLVTLESMIEICSCNEQPFSAFPRYLIEWETMPILSSFSVY